MVVQGVRSKGPLTSAVMVIHLGTAGADGNRVRQFERDVTAVEPSGAIGGIGNSIPGAVLPMAGDRYEPPNSVQCVNTIRASTLDRKCRAVKAPKPA